MTSDLFKAFQRLRTFRQESGLSQPQVEAALIVGPGWIDRFESGEVEPSFSAVVAMLNLYNRTLSDLFKDIDYRATDVTIGRHLTAFEDGPDLVLVFPMGKFSASVTIPNASNDEFDQVLEAFRAVAASGTGNDDTVKRQAIVACYLTAARLWPHANPSDLWYFLAAHVYQDDLNHPASAAGGDWAQSWKRAGGWSLEKIFVDHYNPFLAKHGIYLTMPPPATKRELLDQMGIRDEAAVDKSDVIVVGRHSDGSEKAFGVVHVKASFAERRTDDVPLSQRLIASNYASPLLTMDCKAKPEATPKNKGELGAVQGGTQQVSAKRLDIERDRYFDIAFSYNANTLPTPEGTTVAARIYVCSFANPDDRFSRYLIRKWRDRQGLD